VRRETGEGRRKCKKEKIRFFTTEFTENTEGGLIEDGKRRVLATDFTDWHG